MGLFSDVVLWLSFPIISIIPIKKKTLAVIHQTLCSWFDIDKLWGFLLRVRSARNFL
jgi:hypothetical protein